MQYTLTKYLTADYLRENDFLKAYLELVDEIIFCCSMESLDVLSNMSFESMDDNYFIAYQNFFLNGLSTYDINKLDKLVLSEWFSLLHVRGELSDIDKLLKFGGSLKNKEKNVFELYHNADVPNQTVETTKDGLIYLITENNIDLDSDYFINQQIPAGYRIGLMRTPPPSLVRSGDAIYLGTKECNLNINVDSGDVTYLNKEFEGNIAFYRRRQFDQYYTFAQVYRSQYTVNQLSQYHQTGYYFFGFEIEHTIPLPVSYDVNETVYGGATSTYGEFYINDGSITSPDYPSDKNSFAVLDNTTGEVVHTSEVAHTGFISFTQMYKVAPIAHTGFISFTQLFRVPDDSMRFIEEPPDYNTAYFNPGQGNDQMSVQYAWGSGGDNYEAIYPLDSDQGVRYDPTKVYTVKSVFYADGREITDEQTLNNSVQLMNSPFVSGWLVIRTKVNNAILGNPCGCTYIEEENLEYIEILFNLTYTGDPNTFGSNDYWASNIRNNSDLQTLQDFGVNILNSSGSDPDRVSSSNSNFTFVPIGLYGASDEDLGADMSNFYCAAGPSGNWAYCICIWSRNAYSTGVYTWKCRITKNS